MVTTLSSHWLFGRFTILLLLLLAAILVAPLLGDSLVERALFNGFITLLLLSGVHAAGLRRREKFVAWVLVLASVAARTLAHGTGSANLHVASDLLAAIFFGYVTIELFLYVVRATDVNMNVLSAALSVYLLLGMTFAFLYSALDLTAPGSFSIPDDIKGMDTFQLATRNQVYIYFSLVTMTTTGFGDIRPVSRIARSFTVLEILIGQIYLVVMIARLVSSWGTGPSVRK